MPTERDTERKPGGGVMLLPSTRNAKPMRGENSNCRSWCRAGWSRLGQLSTMAVEHAETHLKSLGHYKTKDSILREPFGERPAAAITPQDINDWLTKHCKTPATANRYRAFMSLSYRLGMENGKVESNPARLVRMRTENNARLRFLTRNEYKKVLGIVQRDNPKQVPAFIVSVYTGMRWGEQFSLEWGQVDMKRKVIRLTVTKNGSARNVPINSVALKSLTQHREAVPHGASDPVFPRPGPKSDCR